MSTDETLAMIRKIQAAQEFAAELRAEGYDVEAAVVNTNPDAPGFKVTCSGCGRTARLPFAPPFGKSEGVCPACQRLGRRP